MKKQLLAALCCVLTCAHLHATNIDEHGIISGTIITADGQPAAGVSIKIKNTNKGTVTDQKGAFTFRNVKPGDYVLQITMIGHGELSREVTVKAGETVTLDIRLEVTDKQLEEVLVNGSSVNKFADRESYYVARMPLKNLENPQVYTVVPKELIEEQMATDFKSLFKNIPGATHSQTSLQGINFFQTRGFRTNGNIRNGLQSNIQSDIELANIERVESIRGPSGTLFGTGSQISYGGLFNVVTKKPHNTREGSITLTTGSWNLFRLAADVNVPLNEEKETYLRVNAARQKQSSFQDQGVSDTWFFAPSLSFKVSDRLSVLIDIETFNRNATSPYSFYSNATLGVKSVKDIPIDFKRSFLNNTLSMPTKTFNAYALATYRISDNWVSQTNFSYNTGNTQINSVYMTAVSDTSARRTLDFQNWSTYTQQFQQNINGTFHIGAVKNQLLVGFDVVHYNYDWAATYGTADTLNFTNPGPAYVLNIDDARVILPGLTPFHTQLNQWTFSGYVSDAVHIADRLTALIGARIDKFDNKGTYNLVTGTTTGQNLQTSVSPKFGLVYQVIKDQLSVFGNYMNGFKNVLGRDSVGNAFDPEQANQTEFGIKTDLFKGKLSASVSVYDIEVDNIVRTDVNNPAFSIQDGAQLSKGFDVDIVANPFRGLNIILGYAYNESKYVRSAKNVEGLRPSSAGARNAANVWASYRFRGEKLKGLGIGAGANYVGVQYAQNTTAYTLTVPEYVLMDASVFYDKRNFRIAVKLDNITNERYWAASLAPQTPRKFSASISYKL